MTTRRLVPLLFLLWLVGASPAQACSIPVFRYALERWRSEREEDLYRVVVFHRGPLSPEEKSALDRLQTLSEVGARRANFVTELVDVSGKMTDDVRKLWEAQKNPTLPWMVLRFPESDEKRPTPWAGPLTKVNVGLLTESPARKEIARRILAGDSVVWVLLESGDTVADDAAAKLLQTELKRLEKVVELPEGLGEGPVKLLSELPVRIAFSMIRLSRTDSAEQAFIGMLLNTEDDLPEEKGPMAFAVFGRGRAMPALVGKGINADMLQRGSEFLCGACSCQVKRLNPGYDMLMAVNWDAILENPDQRESERGSLEGQPVPIPTGKATGEVSLAIPESRPARFVVFGVIGGGLLVVLAIGAVLWVTLGRTTEGE
jgi:hypothetical protein